MMYDVSVEQQTFLRLGKEGRGERERSEGD